MMWFAYIHLGLLQIYSIYDGYYGAIDETKRWLIKNEIPPHTNLYKGKSSFICENYNDKIL